MTDVFLNSLQLNTSLIQCNITGHAIKKGYRVENTSIYGQTSTVVYPASGEQERYEFNISLLVKSSGVLSNLFTMASSIYTELHSPLINRIPIKISTNDTEIYLNFSEVYVIPDEFDFKVAGEDGNRFIDITLNCTVLGVSVSVGGTVDPNNPWN